MKKLQKIILSVLLLTFAFIIVHDYVILGANQNIKHEISHIDCDTSLVDATSNLHESVHNLLFEVLVLSENSSIISPYQKQIQQRDLFISQIGSVLQRPPLS